MIKERPILFSTPMVQAILAGRKTQTRRVVKPQKNEHLHLNRDYIAEYDNGELIKCPYGQPGDVLWVRESITYVMLEHAHDLLEGSRERTQYVYKASINNDWMAYAKEKYGYKWTPSIHMPKFAARIWLEITNVRVERLQDITENDAKAEGIFAEPGSVTGRTWYQKFVSESEARLKGAHTESAKECFQTLWDSINGKPRIVETDQGKIELPPVNWESNPWVWVVEFKKIEKP